MAGYAELIKEIGRLPPKYIGEVYDFVGFLQKKTENQHNDDSAAYQAMASDTEREQEAREWCNAYFGPK